MNILIAEDHSLTANMLANVLSREIGINIVSVVADGFSVIDAVKKYKIDICLLDISLPHLDGLQTMEKLLKDNLSVKILILSAHTEKWVIERSLALGASGYLTKHAEVGEVIEAIRKIGIGDFYFDQTCKSVLNNEVKIFKKEMKVN